MSPESPSDKGDVFQTQCPSRALLDRVCGKWPALIICALGDRTLRYKELHELISGLSQKMLTQTLRDLERDGIVERKVYAEVPPRVEYRLTDRGRSLYAPLHALCRWAEEHSAEAPDRKTG